MCAYVLFGLKIRGIAEQGPKLGPHVIKFHTKDIHFDFDQKHKKKHLIRQSPFFLYENAMIIPMRKEKIVDPINFSIEWKYKYN